MSVLLDANVLIALVVVDHVHHELVETWFSSFDNRFASCPLTQGALIRLVLRGGGSADQALYVLRSATSQSRHDFWAADRAYEQIALAGVVGHRQVTDAYLAGLARHRHGRLATLDGGLAALHSDVAFLVETGTPTAPITDA